jgi:hypothetical protein
MILIMRTPAITYDLGGEEINLCTLVTRCPSVGELQDEFESIVLVAVAV